MARNKLSDLNNHLFAQLERLNDEDLSAEELDKEVERAKAISGIAKNVIENAKLTLEATKYAYNEVSKGHQLPEQFQLPEKK